MHPPQVPETPTKGWNSAARSKSGIYIERQEDIIRFDVLDPEDDLYAGYRDSDWDLFFRHRRNESSSPGASNVNYPPEEKEQRRRWKLRAAYARRQIFQKVSQCRYPMLLYLHGDVARDRTCQQLPGVFLPAGTNYPDLNWTSGLHFMEDALFALYKNHYEGIHGVNPLFGSIAEQDEEDDLTNKSPRGPQNEFETPDMLLALKMLRHSIVMQPLCVEQSFWFRGPPNRFDASCFNLSMMSAFNRLKELGVSDLQGDRRRIYLSGLSMGGYGVLELGACWGPSVVAGILSLAPCRETRSRPQQETWFVERLRKIPLWIFHSRTDICCKVEETLSLVFRMVDEKRHSNCSVPLLFSTGGLPCVADCFDKHSRTGNVFHRPGPYLWLFQHYLVVEEGGRSSGVVSLRQAFDNSPTAGTATEG